MESIDAARGPEPLRRPGSAARRLSRRAFMRACVGGAALAGGYSFGLERRWLQVERVTYALPRLPAAFDGFTIAQLSDVHFGRVVRPTYIRAAADLALSLRPDLIVLTGDYVSR